jgi:ABC-type transport system involved in cytochrome c biogenesis ATPase subunit/GNAT superfamily N-acetyltransferase
VGKFRISVGYETGGVVSSRTVGVGEAFGLGVDEAQRFVLFDDVELRVGVGDVVYVTGDSGSGKSVLLRAFLGDLGGEAVDMAGVCVDVDRPVIDCVGGSFGEGLELLSKAGLNDAFLFVRRFRELSDGQKYRFRIAKLMESGKRWWVADEFCSLLDRDTAKVVAFNLQKVARQLGKAVIVATSHGDLFEDLSPSVYVHKRFGKEISVRYFPNVPAKECSLTKEMCVEEGGFGDYKRLSVFHYRSSRCPPPRKIFVLRRGDELCGVIVYSFPSPVAFGRSRVWKGSFGELQRDVSVVSRVVVHPKYRSIGLGVKLVRETLARAGTPCVEALAVMAKYNPFFERAGMQKVAESKPSAGVLFAIGQLRGLGFDSALLGSVGENRRLIERVGRSKIVKILEDLSKRDGVVRRRLLVLGSVYPSHGEFLEKLGRLGCGDLAVVLKRLAFMAQTKTYLFWRKSDSDNKRK